MYVRIPSSSGWAFIISVWWNREIKGWYVDSTNKNWRGSPLNAMRSRDWMMVCKMVRPATSKSTVGYRIGRKKTESGRTVADTAHMLVRKHSILVEVCQSPSLFDVCGRKSMGIRLVVSELWVNKVINLQQMQSLSKIFNCAARNIHSTVNGKTINPSISRA